MPVHEPASATGRPSPLRGRSSECALLDILVSAIRRGESRSLVLRGEAGIGKTALLEHMIASATGVTVVRAVGVEVEMELAYASLHQLCAPMLRHLERLPDPQREALEIVFGIGTGPPPDRFLVGLGTLSLISEAAEERPLLCVVDDAQWLDHASALTLGFVARRLVAEPVGLMFATRERGDELRHVAELEVRGLPNGDARALLRSVVRFVMDEPVRDRIVAETHGNPLALLELPRGLTALELAGGFGVLGARMLPGRIEESFARRVDALSHDARRLLLVAAAEPSGDPLLLWRAAQRLGIGPLSAEEPEAHALLAIGERVTFHHPLVRSAVYGSATEEERRDVHLALAQATDREADPDRRAWHLAAAAAAPDEQVALELERSAGRAQKRGGVAATAAFLQRAVALTPDAGRRAERALAAAQASLRAGAFEEAGALAATVEAGPLDPLQHARVELLRAEVAFASNRGSAAPALLLRAGKRIEPLDARLARAGYLEALSAALFAARLAGPGGGVREVAEAVRAAPLAAGPPSAADLLLDAWSALFADGGAVAARPLQTALEAFDDGTPAADQLQLLWLVTITAPVVWDDGRWNTLSERHVALARRTGALSELPLALNSRSFLHLFRGELETAGGLIEEARVAIEATGASLTPWGAVALAALRGDEQEALPALEIAVGDATRRGEGIGLTVVAWARALLHNGLGAYDEALAAATEAVDCPTNSAAAVWGMVELVEAAAKLGERDAAAEHAERFAALARAAGTDWALGVDARTRALVSTGAAADQLHRVALDRLGRSRMRVDLARAHLLYGEWLRRQHRRLDARAQLRAAHDHFTSIGLDAFAERAGRELAATGEKVRRPAAETRDDLTAQERQIAELAREGLTNPEIGARLFLSPRTVEWHLRKVFAKLGVRSRLDLPDALSSSELTAAPT